MPGGIDDYPPEFGSDQEIRQAFKDARSEHFDSERKRLEVEAGLMPANLMESSESPNYAAAVGCGDVKPPVARKPGFYWVRFRMNPWTIARRIPMANGWREWRVVNSGERYDVDDFEVIGPYLGEEPPP